MMGALTLPILDGIPCASDLAIRRGGVPITTEGSGGTIERAVFHTPAPFSPLLLPQSKAAYHGENAFWIGNLTMPDDPKYLEELAPSEDKVLVAKMGVEGGGLSIYGKRSDGAWSFWKEGTSMYLDENDDDVWRSWSSDPVADLDLVLPKELPMFYPQAIHPEFLAWFRDAYEKARSRLSPEMRVYQEDHRHGQWLWLLGGGTGDF